MMNITRRFAYADYRSNMIAAAILLTLHSSVNAASMNLIATQDTWTAGTGTTDATPHDGEGLRLADSTAIVFLQFNLADLPANAYINSARIEMFLVSASSSTANNIYADGFTDSAADGSTTFDEATFTRALYSGNPASDVTVWEANEADRAIGNFEAGVLGNSTALPTLDQFYATTTADATDLEFLRGVYDVGGANRNVIFQIWAPGVTGTHVRTFEDREGTLTGNIENAPRLVVDYTVVPEPSSLILSGISIAGIVVRRRKSSRK